MGSLRTSISVGVLALGTLVAGSGAQVVTAAAAGATAAAPHLVAATPAILTSAVSSGSAHVGQAVLAKLASGAALSNGAKLPAGTQLLGHITQAIPAQGKQGKSSLGMVFDHFKGANGQSMPLDVSRLSSVGNGNTQASADASAQASAQPPIQSTAPTQGNGNPVGGLLGGVTGAVGSTVNGVGTAVTGLVGTVTSLPGVVLDSTGTLVAQGRNVQVPAGTQVSVSADVQAGARQ